MMSREEEGVKEEESGVFHSGNRFKTNRKRTLVEREWYYSELEERYTSVIF
jgi:hypothetical protein